MYFLKCQINYFIMHQFYFKKNNKQQDQWNDDLIKQIIKWNMSMKIINTNGKMMM